MGKSWKKTEKKLDGENCERKMLFHVKNRAKNVTEILQIKTERVRKMIGKNGNVNCDVCGKYLGNINGDGNYFALIKMKRCPDCQTLFNKEKRRAWNQEKRRKEKLKKRETKDEIAELRAIVEGLREENDLLHKRINQLRDEQFQRRVQALESAVREQAQAIENLKRR